MVTPFLRGGTYLAEIHALHAFASQRRADGRRWAGLPGAYYEFDDLVFLEGFLGHCRSWGKECAAVVVVCSGGVRGKVFPVV